LQLDFSRQYWTDVFDPFLEAYAEVRAVALAVAAYSVLKDSCLFSSPLRPI
jgi:hypothetical protein